MSSHNPEDEYFTRLEAEQKAKLKKQIDAEKAELAKEERKKLHYLKCGKCGGEMDTVPHRGVEIEVCKDCGAVLLDPGELETLEGPVGGFFESFLHTLNLR